MTPRRALLWTCIGANVLGACFAAAVGSAWLFAYETAMAAFCAILLSVRPGPPAAP